MCRDIRTDIKEVARIGLMFLDGDKLENVLADRYSIDEDDINYNPDVFNELKITLLKIEKIIPMLGLVSALWQLRPDNPDMVVPVIFGSEKSNWKEETTHLSTVAAPWSIQPVNQWMKHVFITGEDNSVRWGNGIISYYFAIKNSDGDITGVLELYISG